MIQYFLDVTLAWTIFYFIYLLLLKKETFFGHNRIYLLSTLIIGMMLPILRHVTLVQSPEETSVIYSFGEQVYAAGHIINTQPESSLNFMQILTWIFWIGVCWSAMRLILGLVKIYQLYHRGEKHHLGTITLVQSAKYHLPFSFFKWIFWSTSYPLKPELKDRIIQHEGVHVQEMHSLDILLVEIIGIFFWWNPLIYQYRKSLRSVHEYVADHTVLEHTELNLYKAILLNQKMSGLQLALTHQFFHSQLKKRIMMMSKNPSTPILKLKYLILIPFAVLLVSVFAFKNSEVPTSEQQLETIVQNHPIFPGCELLPENEQQTCSEKRFLEFVYKTIRYPALARKNLTVGLVALSFDVNENGFINNPIITESLDPVIDEELMRVFTELKAKHPKWTPKIEHGGAVSTTVNLPVEFRLEGDGNESKTNMPPELKERYADRAVVTAYLPKGQNEVKLKSDLLPKTRNGTEREDQVQLTPIFPGCELEDSHKQNACSEHRFLKFMYKNIKYPIEARQNSINGHLELTFRVDEKGYIDNPKITKSLDPVLEQELLRLFGELKAKYPKWTPKKINGKPISSTISLPVEFKLQSSGKKSNVLVSQVRKEKQGGIVVVGYSLESQKPVQPEMIQVPVTDKKPLMIIDGVRVGKSMDKINEIKPGEIYSVNVLKGEQAIKEYGPEAKDGAISIITKKAVNGKNKFVLIIDGEEKGLIKDPEKIKLDADEILTKTVSVQGKTKEYEHYGTVKVITKKGSAEQRARFVTGKTKGMVLDESGLPIPGVSVIIKGQASGTITDQDGRFSLNTPDVNNFLSFHHKDYFKRSVVSHALKETVTTMQKIEPLVTVTSKANSAAIDSDQQLKEIKGTVVNEEGQPLIGTVVIVKGTKTGTITDVDGEFALKLSQQNAILIFSYVGYEKAEIPIGNQQKLHVILRKSRAQSINSIPKGIQTKNDLEVREFGAFPNPTKDKIKVTFLADPKPIEIRVLTPSGQELYKKLLPNFKGTFDEEINFKPPADGWVLLSIQQDDKMFTKVILIQ